MNEGGKLSIKAETKKDEVFLSIIDTGYGIPKKNIKKLFDPLFTTKARGIGLGLFVSKSLMEINEGKIQVESKEGEGTNFILIFPLPGKSTL